MKIKLILVAAAMLAMSACGTVKGFGQDVQTVGSWIEGGGNAK